MPGYAGQPGMAMPGMRGGPIMGGYPGQQPMMQQARPRYPGAPGGQPGMPMPYGMPPPQMGYPGMPGPNYPVRPNGAQGARPPAAVPAANGRPSPVGAPLGLPAGAVPRGQMPVRPQTQGFAEQTTQSAPRLSAQSLARAGPAEQKQMLGESLYPLIHETQPDLSGKITGMLLEMDNGELLHLIESPPALQEKVDEALRVLAEWGKGGEPPNGEAPKAEEETKAEPAKEEAPVKEEK